MKKRTTTRRLYSTRRTRPRRSRILSEALKFAPTNPQSCCSPRASRQAQQPTRPPSRRPAGLEDDPANADALTVLGQVLHETDRYDEAIELLERALEPTRTARGAQLLRRRAEIGRPTDEAREQSSRHSSSTTPCTAPTPTSTTWSISPKGRGRSCSTAWKRSSKRSKNHDAERFLPLHFAYAKALEDRGEHERALEHYIAGGRMKRAQLDYNEDETFGFFDDIRAGFPQGVFEDRTYRGQRRRPAGLHRRDAAFGLDAGRADHFEPPRRLSVPARSNISAGRSGSCATASRRCPSSRR